MLSTNSTSPRCLIPIHIETLTGTSFELLVSPSEQIQHIKRKIERREGIPMNHQHLIWKSTELDDESCLNDYHIEAGTSIKLVLTMRGGPVNTRRVPIEDNLIRDMSEYMENAREDYGTGNDLISPSNKNVTFLVLRDGDQFNFFQVIDRGDGTLSPLSGSMSATSMYNTRETLTVDPEHDYDEKRRADDQKTKQKMEQIRSKLKTHGRKDTLVSSRPSSSTKQTKANLIHHHRRAIRIDTSSNISVNGDNSSGASSLEQNYKPLPYNYAKTNLFNPYSLLAAHNMHHNDLLNEEDSDEDDEDDDDSHDDDDDDADDEQKQITHAFASRSFSPSLFYSKSHPNETALKVPLVQHSTTPTTASITDVNSNAVLVDYQSRMPPITSDKSSIDEIQITKDPSANFVTETGIQPLSDNIHSSQSVLTKTAEPNTNDENQIVHQAPTNVSPMTKNKNDPDQRDETLFSKALMIDDDEALTSLDEYANTERILTNRSLIFRQQKNVTNTSASTPVQSSISNKNMKSNLPAAAAAAATTTTQSSYPSYKSFTSEQQMNKSGNRPLMPLSLSKYRRIPLNSNSSNSSKQPTWMSSGQNSPSTSVNTENNPSVNSFNESLVFNRRLESVRSSAKQTASQSNLPSPSPSTPLIAPSQPSTKRFVQQQEINHSSATVPSTPTPTIMPLDNTKVTIETIGSKTVSALLRQNATIEPVDTSRGVGKHLVSLLTNASKDTISSKTTHSKPSMQDVVIEERFLLEPKSNNWSNSANHTGLTSNNNFQSATVGIYNSNKLPPVTVNRKSTSKCFLCKKKTGLATTYQCRCGSSFCSEHRYPEAHACPFDYKAEGKRLIERNNPLVTAPKLPKI